MSGATLLSIVALVVSIFVAVDTVVESRLDRKKGREQRAEDLRLDREAREADRRAAQQERTRGLS